MIDFEKFCELLSDYFDKVLEEDICSEIDELVNEDLYCKTMFNTFNKTLELLREFEIEEIAVPEEVHMRLYELLKIKIRKKK